MPDGGMAVETQILIYTVLALEGIFIDMSEETGLKIENITN